MISDTQMAAPPITRHEFHCDWSYTLKPTKLAFPKRAIHLVDPVAMVCQVA